MPPKGCNQRSHISFIEAACTEIIIIFVRVHWDGCDTEPRILQGTGHNTNLKFEALADSLVNATLTLHYFNNGLLVGR